MAFEGDTLVHGLPSTMLRVAVCPSRVSVDDEDCRSYGTCECSEFADTDVLSRPCGDAKGEELKPEVLDADLWCANMFGCDADPGDRAYTLAGLAVECERECCGRGWDADGRAGVEREGKRWWA